MRDGYKPPFFCFLFLIDDMITKEELNEVIINHSYPYYTPLPKPFYQKDGLERCKQ